MVVERDHEGASAYVSLLLWLLPKGRSGDVFVAAVQCSCVFVGAAVRCSLCVRWLLLLSVTGGGVR